MTDDKRVSESDRKDFPTGKSFPISRGELNDALDEVTDPKIRVWRITREVVIRLIDRLEQM